MVIGFPGVSFIVMDENENLQSRIRDVGQKIHKLMLKSPNVEDGFTPAINAFSSRRGEKLIAIHFGYGLRNAPNGRGWELIEEIATSFIFLVKGMCRVLYSGITPDCSYAEVTHRRLVARMYESLAGKTPEELLEGYNSELRAKFGEEEYERQKAVDIAQTVMVTDLTRKGGKIILDNYRWVDLARHTIPSEIFYAIYPKKDIFPWTQETAFLAGNTDDKEDTEDEGDETEEHSAEVTKLIELGSARFDNGDLLGAIDAFQKAIRSDVDSALAWASLGGALWKKGDLEEASSACKRALQIDPNSTAGLGNLGMIRQTRGDIDGAVKLYEKVIQIEPKNVIMWSNLGVARVAKGDLQGAVETFVQALMINPRYEVLWNNVGTALSKQGKMTEACFCWRLAGQAGHKAAQRSFEEVSKMGVTPNPPDFFKLVLQNEDRKTHFVEEMKKLDELGASIGFSFLAVQAEKQRELLALELERDFEDFIKDKDTGLLTNDSLRLIITSSPKLKCARYIFTGCRLHNQGYFSLAAVSFQYAAFMDTTYDVAWNWFGSTLMRLILNDSEGSMIKGAAYALKKAVEINPQHFSAWSDLSMVYMKQNNLPEMKNALQKAVAIDPKRGKEFIAMITTHLQDINKAKNRE